MPTYDYQCPKCDTVKEVYHSINQSPLIVCPGCETQMNKVILCAPATVIPPQHQATGAGVGSKFKYYGITDPITGAGITKDTNVSQPPGIKVKTIA